MKALCTVKPPKIFTYNNNNNNNNNLVYNAHSIEESSDRKRGQSPGGQKQIASVSGQLTKEMRFKSTFKVN